MPIRNVLPEDTPNQGRQIWNRNDAELEKRLASWAYSAQADDFGAAGDGIQDDSQPIQAAIDARHESGGGNVILPPGVYLIKSSPIFLRDGVNLLGSGPQATSLRADPELQGPLLTDVSAMGESNFAFGIVKLADFSLYGHGTDRSDAVYPGIFTSAYYSIFSNLQIYDCSGNGIQVGRSGLENFASQNSFQNCRVGDCGDTGIFLDVNAIDSVISECFVRDCLYGIVVRNGGMRISNNAIFGHKQAGVHFTQTTTGAIISLNDFNYNARTNIEIRRTTVETSSTWSQVLVYGNSMLGDGLVADAEFDAITVDSEVDNGISRVGIIGNKIYKPESQFNRYRYGVHFVRNVELSYCRANDIRDVALSPYQLGPNCRNNDIDSLGNVLLPAPPIPPSGQALVNPYQTNVTVYVAGGDVQSIEHDFVPTGLTFGTFRLRSGQAISLEYAAPPSWRWVSE